MLGRRGAQQVSVFKKERFAANWSINGGRKSSAVTERTTVVIAEYNLAPPGAGIRSHFEEKHRRSISRWLNENRIPTRMTEIFVLNPVGPFLRRRPAGAVVVAGPDAYVRMFLFCSAKPSGNKTAWGFADGGCVALRERSLFVYESFADESREARLLFFFGFRAAI